jgi:hypothetical protein
MSNMTVNGPRIQQLIRTLSNPNTSPARAQAASRELTNLFRDSFQSAQRSNMPNLSGYGGRSDSISNELKLPDKPQNPGPNANDQQLLKYQEDMQKYQRTLTMLTQMLQMQHEGKKSVVQNFRA